MGKLGVAKHFMDQAHATPGIRGYAGNFLTNNVADPVSTSNNGIGWSVTRTGVGTFRVTFNRSFRKILAYWGGCLSATRAVQVIAKSAGSLRNAATIDLQVQSALGTAVETTGVEVVFEISGQDVVTHKGQ